MPPPSDGTRSYTFRTGHIATLSNGACEGFGTECTPPPLRDQLKSDSHYAGCTALEFGAAGHGNQRLISKRCMNCVTADQQNSSPPTAVCPAGSLATPPRSSLHGQLAVSPRLALSLIICFNTPYWSLMSWRCPSLKRRHTARLKNS